MMDERTKTKILDTLREIPLADLARREAHATTDEDRRFWHSLYLLEKGQREQIAM